MTQFNSARRAFLSKMSFAVAGTALLLPQDSFAKLITTNAPFEGYNPFAEEKSDLRAFLSSERAVTVSGTVISRENNQPVANALIEVWHLSPGTKKYRHRGKIKTDSNGKYHFITDFPNNTESKKARIYFKTSKDATSDFTELALDSQTAHITNTHWEKNRGLAENVFPTCKKTALGTQIQFNYSI